MVARSLRFPGLITVQQWLVRLAAHLRHFAPKARARHRIESELVLGTAGLCGLGVDLRVRGEAHLHLRVLQDVEVVLLAAGGVDGHRDGADAQDGLVHEAPLAAVAAANGHGVARQYAER